MAELRVILPDDVDRYLESVIKSGMFGNKAELTRAAIVHFLNTIGPISKGYDTDTFFSPDGRIFQIEYAREAMMKGGLVIGIVCSDGVLLASEDIKSRFDSKLVVSPLKLHRLSENLLVGHSGLVADAMVIIDHLRERDFKDEDEVLTVIRDLYWSYTTQKDIRPLGAGLLLGTLFKRPRLFEVDPSGAINEYVATAMGVDMDRAKERLAKDYRRVGTKDAGKLISKVFGEGAEYVVETLISG
jgi:20S proteasome alpha/beta subunit